MRKEKKQRSVREKPSGFFSKSKCPSKVRTLLKSDLHRKIIIFFHQNPSSIDTPRGVAAWVNYDRPKVNKALKELSKHKILNVHRSATATGYSYTTDKKIIKKIKKQLQNI